MNENLEFDNRIDLSVLKISVDKIKERIKKIIVGQEQMIDLIITAILCGGHVIIEGVPGVAKTVTAKLIGKCLDIPFSRIQFTPDLMPSDIIGTSIYNQSIADFQFKKGPIFSNIVLVDEINRAPAKTQAALFEVMAERQITQEGNTYLFEAPFIVIATQNPIEQEGTYKLPEAQLDRFLFKINVGYPNLEEEIQIIKNHNIADTEEEINSITPVLSQKEISDYQKLVKQIHVEDSILEYIAKIVTTTRNHPGLYLGASPRASIAILNASKAFSAIKGKDFISPEEIKYIAPSVLSHRIIMTPEREMEGMSASNMVNQIINSIEIPR